MTEAVIDGDVLGNAAVTTKAAWQRADFTGALHARPPSAPVPQRSPSHQHPDAPSATHPPPSPPGAYFTFARFSHIDLTAVTLFVAELSDVRMDTRLQRESNPRAADPAPAAC